MANHQGPAERTRRDPQRPRRLLAISCEVLARPVYLYTALSVNVIDVTLLRRRLHDTPKILRAQLQEEIDAASAIDSPYDAIVLAYGLCGGATAGIVARDVPVVLPRAHDCVTIMLGGRKRYESEFSTHPGTYWYASDYLERDEQAPESGGLAGMGAATREAEQAIRADFVERFGEENAEYLMEVMGGWAAHYDRAALLDTGWGDRSRVEALVRTEAEQRGWVFERLAADLGLVRRLLDGEWDADFMILSPGQSLAMSYDADVVRAEGKGGPIAFEWVNESGGRPDG